jgi:hypothetical protein
MYRRVLIPMGIVIGTAVAIALLGMASTAAQNAAMEQAMKGQPGRWMLPVLPTGSWLLFPLVFLAVRLCSLRGGSRRECIAVGMVPVVLALIPWVATIVTSGPSSLLVALGSTAPVVYRDITLGAALTIRETTAHLLNLAAACLSATWLWFFVSKQGAEMGTGSAA